MQEKILVITQNLRPEWDEFDAFFPVLYLYRAASAGHSRLVALLLQGWPKIAARRESQTANTACYIALRKPFYGIADLFPKDVLKSQNILKDLNILLSTAIDQENTKLVGWILESCPLLLTGTPLCSSALEQAVQSNKINMVSFYSTGKQPSI